MLFKHGRHLLRITSAASHFTARKPPISNTVKWCQFKAIGIWLFFLELIKSPNWKKLIQFFSLKFLKNYYKENVSGYVSNNGSPSGERDTASPRGRYGERPQRDSVWRYIWKNTTCWPATAHDVTTGVPQYKCRREDTSSASSSEACIRSMAQSPGDAVSRSPLGEPWWHT